MMIGRSLLGFSAFYPIHTLQHEVDRAHRVQLTVWMKSGTAQETGLELSVHPYGTLNLNAITGNLEDGLRQLDQSAAREEDQRIARVIVLAFASGIGFHLLVLEDHIATLLKDNPRLCAIAVLSWLPEGSPPAEEDGLWSRLAFQGSAPRVPAFRVYHNPWLEGVNPLDPQAFADGLSTQVYPSRQ